MNGILFVGTPPSSSRRVKSDLRDVGDAVPYTIIAPYTALFRHLFVVLTLNHKIKKIKGA